MNEPSRIHPAPFCSPAIDRRAALHRYEIDRRAALHRYEKNARRSQSLIPQSLIPRFPDSPHIERVEAWARAVCNAWGPHHETARRWAGL